MGLVLSTHVTWWNCLGFVLENKLYLYPLLHYSSNHFKIMKLQGKFTLINGENNKLTFRWSIKMNWTFNFIQVEWTKIHNTFLIKIKGLLFRHLSSEKRTVGYCNNLIIHHLFISSQYHPVMVLTRRIIWTFLWIQLIFNELHCDHISTDTRIIV